MLIEFLMKIPGQEFEIENQSTEVSIADEHKEEDGQNTKMYDSEETLFNTNNHYTTFSTISAFRATPSTGSNLAISIVYVFSCNVIIDISLNRH
jgi:hypothetical protein